MAIIIKKITRRTMVSVASIGSIIIALIARIFLGGSHVNLSKINSRALDIIKKDILVNKAQADVPDSGCVGSAGGDGYEGSTGDY